MSVACLSLTQKCPPLIPGRDASRCQRLTQRNEGGLDGKAGKVCREILGLFISVSIGGCVTCHGAHVQLKGQMVMISSFFPP